MKTFASAVLICTAVMLVLYPFISNLIFETSADSKVAALQAEAEKQSENYIYENEIKRARQYNRQLSEAKIRLTDPFDIKAGEGSESDYDSLLNMTQDGIMGYIEIPSADISLPVYHGASSDSLSKGAGHLEGTSLPVGGKNTHAVITGHTGLSGAKMFSDLQETEEGDVFFLCIMGKTYAYKIVSKKTVEPSELEELYIAEGKDLCTLVTCTPYGINTHRLLVKGERTDYREAASEASANETDSSESSWLKEYKKGLLISASVFASGIAVLILKNIYKRRRAL